MRRRDTVLASFVCCLVAWAADGASDHERQAANLKPQTAVSEIDVIAIPRMLSYQGKLTDTELTGLIEYLKTLE